MIESNPVAPWLRCPRWPWLRQRQLQ